MIITLAEMKRYLRIELDYFEEDEDINAFILGAQEYLKTATGHDFTTNPPELAKLCIKLLVSHWFDNRGIQNFDIGQTQNKIDFTLKALIEQLKYAYPSEGEVL